MSLSDGSQNRNIFEVDNQGLYLLSTKDINGDYSITVKVTDFEGLIYEEAFIISITNNQVTEITETKVKTQDRLAEVEDQVITQCM